MIYYSPTKNSFCIPGVDGGNMVKKFLEIDTAVSHKKDENGDAVFDENGAPVFNYKKKKVFAGFQAENIPSDWLTLEKNDPRLGKHPGKTLVYINGDLELQDIAPIPEGILEQREWRRIKALRDKTIASIVVTTASGKDFEGDIKSQADMTQAATLAVSDTEEVEWKLAATMEPRWQTVTALELREAARLAGLERVRIMKEVEA